MVNLLGVVIANGTGALLMVIIFLSQQKNARYGLFDEKLYYTMAACTIVQCFTETATFFIDGSPLPGLRICSWVINSALYITDISFAFLWTVYADYKIFGDRARLRKKYPLVAVPALMVVAGVVANCFFPVFFTISPDNVYSRSSWYLFPCAVTYFYLAYGVVLIYANRGRAHKYLFMPAIIFMIPILIGSVLQFAVYGLSLIWLGVAIGMVSLYINVQNEANYIDALSGLYSRQYLNSFLAAHTLHPPTDASVAGIMLDIDRFKAINDNFGHQVGDEAIAEAGRLLRKVTVGDGIAARYAGDEFMIIQFVKTRDDIEALMLLLRAETDRFNAAGGHPYTLRFSMGASLYKGPDDTVDAFLKRMDDEMYREKRAKVAAHLMPERRGAQCE